MDDILEIDDDDNFLIWLETAKEYLKNYSEEPLDFNPSSAQTEAFHALQLARSDMFGL